MLEIKHVNKSFGQTQALKDVSLTFEEGKIYGLLGRNGAGKSTLLNVITNRIFADTGEVTVDGMAAQENEAAQRKIYLMSERNFYPTAMKAEEIFHWTAQFYPDFDMAYAKALAEEFGLNLKKTVKGLSTGYASIMKCILALSVNTPYELLDEPVLGLDANHREMFYRLLIEKYSEEPFCCVISTHLIEEISTLIEDIVIIKQGEVIKSEGRENLLAGMCSVSGPQKLVDECLTGMEILGEDSLGGLKTVYVQGCPEDVPAGGEIGPMDLQKLFVILTNA